MQSLYLLSISQKNDQIVDKVLLKKQMLKLRSLRFLFSQSVIPVVDVSNFLQQSGNYTKDCKTVADALHKYGCLIIKDPRVKVGQSNKFLDQMEHFFQRRSTQFYAGKPVPDIFPEQHFQVGATPEYTEKARQHFNIVNNYQGQNKAETPFPPPFDAKWRYFWNIGEDQAQNKIPKDFPHFKQTMEAWGSHMINGCYTVAEMAAIGLGLSRQIFSDALKKGPHKLAPTGSDLVRYPVGTIFAGFHYDFNFLTIHGKSRYPGLYCWLRTGQKVKVAVPQGHLLLQSGKQFEYLTGGYITCGFHEVVYTKQVEERKNQAVKAGKIPWRISSTLFSHVNNDLPLKPLPKYATKEANEKYPSIIARDHTIQQLQAISLKRF